MNMKRLLITLLLLSSLLPAQIPERIRAKSPVLGVTLSVLLPGAGQWYAESKGMAVLYLTLETAGIGGSVYFHQKGTRGVAEYEQYADNHWTVSKWLGTYNPVSDPTTHTATVYVDNRSYSPQIPQSYSAMITDIQDGYQSLSILKDYHFYENIGKYEQFKAGWDDWAPGTENPGNPLEGIYPTYSENQSVYARMRRSANDLLKIGGYFGTALFFNHFISAIDAGLRIRYHNEKQDVSYNFYSAPLIGETGLAGIRGGINIRF